jgi:hypothetical protein
MSFIGDIIGSKAFWLLLIVLIGIFLLGGANIAGIFGKFPWWVIVGIILFIIIIFSKK